MPFTGESIHGWRIADRSRRRRVFLGWVEEPIVELIKGQRHIRATGQDGIDPEIVLGRAVTAALQDDIRDATERQAVEEVILLTAVLDRHERALAVKVNGWAARRVLGKSARMSVSPAGAGGFAGVKE